MKISIPNLLLLLAIDLSSAITIQKDCTIVAIADTPIDNAPLGEDTRHMSYECVLDPVDANDVSNQS